MPLMLLTLRHIPPQISRLIRKASTLPPPPPSYSGLLVCALFLLVGLAMAGDYGIPRDEPTQRRIAQANLNYILGQADSIETINYHDRVYGVAFELPLLLAEQSLGLTDKDDISHLRSLLIHLFFVIGAFFCYRLAWRLFDNRWIARFALLIFLLHPRIYAHSFGNSKDLPFLAMFIIALYLLERAFRRDTIGAFVLLGIAVGLLTNLRIMGIMLFAAALGMRGLDLFYARNWPQRRGVLLTGGLFVLAAGLTLYAAAPYAWANPVDYLAASLELTVHHPNRVWELFQGARFLSTELPPQYNAVWFGITTPPPLLLLGGVGIVAVLTGGLARPGAVFRNTRRRFTGLLLACFLLPPLAAALLSSSQYYDWRHFYFLYAPFSLLAAGGLYWLGRSIARRRLLAKPVLPAGAYGLAGAGLSLTILAMTQIHPLQDLYFNFLVDRTTPEYLRTQYQLRSPNVAAAAALEYLRQRHPDETVALRGYQGQPGFQQNFVAADYALFHVRDDGHQDLAFNGLPGGRLYNNTLFAVKPLRAARMTAAAWATYQELYQQAVAGEPIIRAAYDVYLTGRTLTFVRENCQWDDRARQVFVKIFLPSQVWSIDAAITLRSRGVRWADTCLAVIQLPAYAQGDLIIGQDPAAGESRWEELYSVARPGLGERIAAARWKNRQPALREVFDVFLERDAAGRNELLYAKPHCTEEEYRTRVTLHIYPEDREDLPALRRSSVRRESDHENRDFYLRHLGGRPGGECIARVPLPDYPIREIRTGQSGHWSGSLYPPVDPGPLRAAYAALAAVQPDLRDAFDLYWQDGQLTYIRESCAAADTAEPFFLHLFPAAADLLAEPAAEQDNRDFAFGRWGGHFDGKCLATVPLPDYPIAAIRTGQAGIWEVNFYPPADPEPLRAAYAALADGQPVADSHFALYRQDNRLIYFRESCAAADTAARFFLHIVPEDVAALPGERQAAGFAHQDFAFARWGGYFDGRCLAAIPLPDYPIKEIRTGQHIPGQGDLWSVELIIPVDLDQLRADYAALAAAEPAARDYFDLYWRDNRLTYLRETCAAGDTAAAFFLHIVPENPTDLPANRQDAGFAHGGFEFVRQGGHFDGKCLATVSLPDYPIKEMRTGQYVPGQGDLWSVRLMAAP